MANITASGFISALKEDMDRVTDIVRDDMEDSTSFVMGMIADGGEVDFNDQNDTIEYTAAKPAYKGYRDVDATPRALIEGSMEAHGCTGNQTNFTTDVNEKDANACGGFCEFQFGQGFKTYKTKDYKLPMTTPVVCANDYIRMGEQHVDGYFDGLFNSYRDYGMTNYEAELQNRVIEFGGANASVISPDGFGVTKGGFEAPPESRMTIHFLREYRYYMEYEGALTVDGMLEVEMPRQDWFDAVTEHQVRTNSMGGNASFDSNILTDEKGKLAGRKFHEYDGIKCYFNERPVRGYFKPVGVVNGSTQYNFVRIFPWINKVNEDGGVSAEPNHDYNNATTYCNGQRLKMVTLAFVVHNTAFKRYRIKEAKKRAGSANLSSNFSMEIRDEAYIDNNLANDKFRIISLHQYRLKCWKTERAGAIAYCHSRPAGYIISPVVPDDTFTGEVTAGGQEFDKCLPDALEAGQCEDCGEVVNDNGDCVAAPGDTVIALDPSGGSVETLNFGDPVIVTVRLERKGVFSQEATVDYALTALGAATAGTNYTDISGTVTFAAGSTEPQYLQIEILDGAGLDGVVDGVKLQLSNPAGAAAPTLEDDFLDIIIIDGNA